MNITKFTTLTLFASICACGSGSNSTSASSTTGPTGQDTGGTVGGTTTGGTTGGSTTGGGTTGVVGGTTTGPTRIPPVCSAAIEAADFTATITSKSGPLGGAPFYARGTTSMNITELTVARPDYIPTPEPTFTGMLAALRPAYLRWLPGHPGQIYRWTRTPKLGPLISEYELSPAMVDAFVALCRAVGAEPVIAINFKTGTAAEAADLVRYVNVEKKYNVMWFHIGNEPDLPTDEGLPNPVPILPTSTDIAGDADRYAARYNEFADAIHGVDAGVKIAGPEMMMGEDLAGFGKYYPEWLTPLMQRIGSKVDAISWHYYAKYSSRTPNPNSSAFYDANHTEALLQENAPDWPTAGMNYVNVAYPKVRQVRDQYNAKSEIWVDEFAEEPGFLNGQYLGDRAVGALWAADLLGRYAEQGTNANFRFIFKGDASHYYALVDTKNKPRPEYYVYWLYAQVLGNRWVATQQGAAADISQVAVHASVRASDGALTAVLVNKTTSAKTVHLKLADFTPYSAQQYVVQGTGYSADSMTLNGKTPTMAQLMSGAQAIEAMPASPCGDTTVTVPAYGAVFVVFGK